MADEERTTPDDSVASDEESAAFETDWGEEWESAFEADDYALDDDEGEGAAFQEEISKAAEDAAAAEGSMPPGDSAESIPENAPEAGDIPKALPLIDRLRGLAATSTLWFTALPLLRKILLAGGLVAICLTIALLLTLGPEETDPVVPDGLAVSEDAQLMAPEPPATSEPPVAATPATVPVVLPPEQVRKKFPLPGFLIPTSADEGENSTKFVSIDLTLVALLDEGEELSAEQQTFARDMIYQFFANRPYYELKRYSLARSDMHRNLSAWLGKQWPDNPIATILFDRYHIM